MSSYNAPHRVTFRQGLLAEAGQALARTETIGRAGLTGGRPFAVLILLGVVLVLMVVPAVVASVSVLDGHLMDRAGGWFRWQIGSAPYLDLGRLGSTIALTRIVSSVREDE